MYSHRILVKETLIYLVQFLCLVRTWYYDNIETHPLRWCHTHTCLEQGVLIPVLFIHLRSPLLNESLCWVSTEITKRWKPGFEPKLCHDLARQWFSARGNNQHHLRHFLLSQQVRISEPQARGGRISLPSTGKRPRTLLHKGQSPYNNENHPSPCQFCKG